MKISFLGTNGWYDTKTGNTLCVLIETKNAYVIFDAGNGFYKLDKYVIKNKPVYLFLSHYHLDHTIGLHALNKFRFKRGLDVYGPTGLRMFFKNVIRKPYTIGLADLDMKVRLHEISKNTVLPEGITCAPLIHSTISYGYRLSSEGKTVAFCTDTGLCNNYYALAKEADLLISECSLRPGQINRKWPHLNPAEAAAAAAAAKVKQLALIHFDAYLYLDLKERAKAQKAAKKVFKSSFVCYDDQNIKL